MSGPESNSDSANRSHDPVLCNEWHGYRGDDRPVCPGWPHEISPGADANTLALLTEYNIDQRQLDEAAAMSTRLAVAAFNARRRGVRWALISGCLDVNVTAIVAELDSL